MNQNSAATRLDCLKFQNRFVKLGGEFYQSKPPVPVHSPYWVSFNPDCAALLDLESDAIKNPELLEILSGNRVPEGADPLAMVYSGHQFGSYNPQLGDGRGLLLGEIKNKQGEYWDIYLKGAGQTKFCRGFDGRATLKSSIREYLCQEALHGLGIATTRSLSVVGTGELIYRELPEPAGIVTRLARTHIRFGSFQYFHFTNRPEKVTELADFAIEAYLPDVKSEPDKYRLLFHHILEQTAKMVAGWQSVGFGHGVMNTDNMTLLGETFDFGPFGFMDRFDPNYICNRSDTHGRYAFGRQPEIAQWNLVKLGETLQHLIPADAMQKELEDFSGIFNGLYKSRMAEKLGLAIIDNEFDELLDGLYKILYAHKPDHTNFFRLLAGHRLGTLKSLQEYFYQKPEHLSEWLKTYEKLLDREDIDPEEQQARLQAANPKFILRNYLAQRAIDFALKEQDYSEIERLLVILKSPFEENPGAGMDMEIDPDFYASDTPDSFLGMQISCSA